MAEVTQGSKLLAEFLGTFLLVFTVGCNVLAGNAVWGGVSIACVLMVSIYALGGISGANFNPAVSLALGLTKVFGSNGMVWADVGKYMVMQILGGIVAGICYITLFWDTFNLAPAKGFGAMEAGMCEVIYTFMLCFVVLNTAAAKNRENQFYGLAIGFVIVAGAYGAGAVSGGCFNPAVAVGIDVASAGMGFGWCLSYTVFEFIGAAMAAFLFTVVRPQDFGKAEVPGMSAKLCSEFLGTYMLVFTVGLNVLGKSPSAAYSIAASLMCMIYATGDISGAHFNPAVTIACLASGMCKDSLSPKDAMMYMVVQIIGAIFAGFSYSMVYHWATFGLGPVGVHTWSEVAVAEIIYTFVLCLVVLTVAVSSKGSKDFFGLAIGSCVTVGGFAIGGISGGSLNPAVSFGIAASHSMTANNLPAAFIYSVFEIIGAIFAASVVKVTHAEEPAAKETQP